MRVLGVGTPQSPARAGSAAQRDKPDEMLWLRQRPPRHLGVQMLVCSERPRSLARVEQRVCVLLNGKKQKARPKGVNLKVRWRAKFAMRYRSEESVLRETLVCIRKTAARHKRGE